MDMFELEELKQMRQGLVLTVKEVLVKIAERELRGDLSLTGNYMAQAEMIVKAIEDSK